MEMAAIHSVQRWDGLTVSEQETLAREIGERLPATFAFAELRPCAFVGERRHVAVFTYHSDRPLEGQDGEATAHFALIPGVEVALGYDPERPFAPDAEQEASWRAFTRRYLGEPDADLESYLRLMLTPRRRVRLAPFLLETRAHPLEQVIQLAERFYTYRRPAPTYRGTLEMVSAQGLRFPTPDEWEYACSAGARTLWRWGDHCPSTTVPSPRAAAPAWDLHLRPNAFGLQIARYPTEWELTATVGRLRGGDGGSCLQTESFIQWLTLASAFEMRWDEDADAEVYGAYLRRASSIDPALLAN
jgi:hypothetical protein